MILIHVGSFNRIFNLKFDNGSELIAKIPFPFLTPRHLCTASEVATMDYARTVLGLPVPKVFAWSASAADRTDVGAEYILMEKVEGVELYKRYKNLRSEGLELINQVTAMERAFVARPFSQIGSLYYKEDVEPALQERPLYAEDAEDSDDDASARFRIGPYVDWDIWRGTRANVEADRGPCMFIFFRSPSPIPLIVLRAGCLVVCTSYHQYPTKMAQRICSSAICQ
jgi:hypothetical protein